MRVTVDIPDEFAQVLAPVDEDMNRRLLEDRTAQAYRERRLTMHQVQKILGFPYRMDVDPFLLRYEIFDYTPEMLEKDIAALEGLRVRGSATR